MRKKDVPLYAPLTTVRARFGAPLASQYEDDVGLAVLEFDFSEGGRDTNKVAPVSGVWSNILCCCV